MRIFADMKVDQVILLVDPIGKCAMAQYGYPEWESEGESPTFLIYRIDRRDVGGIQEHLQECAILHKLIDKKE